MLKDKRVIWILLALMMAVQLYIPASMIWGKERIIEEGELMKFRIAPIDPNDPFRGKFIILSYLENTVENEAEEYWEYGEKAFAILREDSFGYAYPIGLQREKPANGYFVKVSVMSSSNESVWIEYPFNKYFMEESKAPLAEKLYFEAIMDGDIDIYALVYINDGEAVLEDVQIDGISIEELVLQE